MKKRNKEKEFVSTASRSRTALYVLYSTYSVLYMYIYTHALTICTVHLDQQGSPQCPKLHTRWRLVS